MSKRSIRFRLTLWYMSASAVGIALFGVLVWAAMREQLVRNGERELDERLGALGRFLEFEARDNNLAAIQEEAREYSTGLPSGRGLRLYDEAGQIVFEKAPGAGKLLVRSREVEARGMRFRAELSVPREQIDETLAALIWVLVGTAPVVLLVAGGMGWWLAGRSLAPVGAMIREARGKRGRELAARLTVPQTGDEMQRLAEAWNELLERIEMSVEAVRRFTADAAHELRTPLAVIGTSAELALRHERGAEEYKRVIASMGREAAAMTQLVEQLLLLARGEAGEWQLECDAMRVGDALRTLEGMLTGEAAERGIELKWELPSTEPLVWGDASAVRRVALIVLDNALKFTPRGGEVRVKLGREKGWAVMEVKDNGAGIAEEDLPHVFERFWRGDRARTGGQGTGLGLSIAKTLVEAQGGEIEVKRAEERGTVVTVRWPTIERAGLPAGRQESGGTGEAG